MQYSNSPGARDVYSFSSYPGIKIGDHPKLSLRLRGMEPTLFTLEIVVDGKRSRLANYQPVPVEWTVWSFPLQGEVLSEITLSIGEANASPAASQYELQIDWIAIQ
jgi:hypothetical protein